MRGRLWLCLLLLAAGCAGPAAVRRAPAPAPAVLGAEERGQATWYGRPHHGRATASGETYDMRALTAAHRTLPFGTRVLVTRIDTGRSVEVRINDRGPWVDGRIIDLSYAAAQQIGAVGAGIVTVRVRVVATPDGTRETPPGANASR
jgi:rare lipoprotein A